MKTRPWTLLGAALLAALATLPARAAADETDTLTAASDTLVALAGLPLKGIPPALLQDARGVAIIPNVLKAGFVFGGRFGRGVILVRGADGSWGNPIFITLAGGSFGWQIGVQSTDIILVFKTSRGLERILNGKNKVTLGADLSVAAGPIGRQVEASTDAQLKSEIYSYSRSRGLFAGLSLEGAGILIDFDANQNFYRIRGGRPADVLMARAIPVAAANLKGQMARLTDPPPVIAPPTPLPAFPMPAPPR
jgi:lipid-binding SYLF domain-containing protein